MGKKVKRIRKIKVTGNEDAVQEFLRKRRERCKHERGFRTNTGSADSYCVDCGKPWYQCK